jgi:amino acid permease
MSAPSIDKRTSSFGDEEKAGEKEVLEQTGPGGASTNAEHLNRALSARQVSLIAMYVAFSSPCFLSVVR